VVVVVVAVVVPTPPSPSLCSSSVSTESNNNVPQQARNATLWWRQGRHMEENDQVYTQCAPPGQLPARVKANTASPNHSEPSLRSDVSV